MMATQKPKKHIVRLDDGIYTHVKIDGKLYRRDTVVKALQVYRLARFKAYEDTLQERK